MQKYGLTVLPPVLREMLETGKYRDAQDVLQPLHSNISSAEALDLYNLVRTLQPKNTAEIGFAFGVSGLSILAALEANGIGRHYVCDPGQTSLVKNMGLENVHRAGLDKRLEFHERYPDEIFYTFPLLQFAFIDASHLFDLSILDFILVDRRLEVGGLVAFHDLWMPSLRKVIRYILANRAYRIHSSSPAGAPLSKKQREASRLAAIARQLPLSAHWLAPEAAKPWHEFRLANLVILEKTGNDSRDWREHTAF